MYLMNTILYSLERHLVFEYNAMLDRQYRGPAASDRSGTGISAWSGILPVRACTVDRTGPWQSGPHHKPTVAARRSTAPVLKVQKVFTLPYAPSPPPLTVWRSLSN